MSGEEVAFRGEVFRVEAFRLESRPRYPVSIYLAALGPLMLRLAGEIADRVILNWATPEQVRGAVALVHDGARRAGRDPSAVRVVCFVRVAVTPDEVAAWAVLRRLVATYAAMPEEFMRALGVVGRADACRERLLRYHAAGADVVAAYPFPVGTDAAASIRATVEGLAPG